MFHRLTPKQQRWRQVWPSNLIGVLAIIQLIFTFAIIGLEITSMIFDRYHSMIYAGFYCSIFFMITWISMFTVVCCNRYSSGCAIHVLVENILSILATIVLLYFDILFLNNPYTCFYGSDDDCSKEYSSYYSIYGIYNPNNYTIKMACIKAQLACTGVILITNIIYIIIFIIVVIKIRNKNHNHIGTVSHNDGISIHVPTQSLGYQTQLSTTHLPSLQQSFKRRSIEPQNDQTVIPIV